MRVGATYTNSVFACTDNYLIAFVLLLCSLCGCVLYTHTHSEVVEYVTKMALALK